MKFSLASMGDAPRCSMLRTLGIVVRLGVVAGIGASMACSDAGGGVKSEQVGATSNAIVGGSRANAYEEAALVAMYQGGQLTAYCSGSVIAPGVVLTAGHCVDGFDSWKITVPYATGGKVNVNASSGTTYDWMENGAETVNPNHHDIGLIFVDTPVHLSGYPQLAQSPLQA